MSEISFSPRVMKFGAQAEGKCDCRSDYNNHFTVEMHSVSFEGTIWGNSVGIWNTSRELEIFVKLNYRLFHENLKKI